MRNRLLIAASAIALVGLSGPASAQTISVEMSYPKDFPNVWTHYLLSDGFLTQSDGLNPPGEVTSISQQAGLESTTTDSFARIVENGANDVFHLKFDFITNGATFYGSFMPDGITGTFEYYKTGDFIDTLAGSGTIVMDLGPNSHMEFIRTVSPSSDWIQIGTEQVQYLSVLDPEATLTLSGSGSKAPTTFAFNAPESPWQGGENFNYTATSGGGGTGGGGGGGTTPIPEPATWAMMLAGFGLAGLRLQRRRTAAV